METKFQTSFIPKKQLTQVGSNVSGSHYGLSSLFLLIAGLIFIASLAGAGGAYFWNDHLAVLQDQAKKDLAARQQEFNISKIEDLKQNQNKIDLARQLIQNHLVLSQVFSILGRFTSEEVRFMNLDLSAPSGLNAAGDSIKITMRGYGTTFPAVAFQSDVLSQLSKYGLRDKIKNPILSDPALDSSGTVSFGFSSTIDANNFLYKDFAVASTTGDQGSNNNQ